MALASSITSRLPLTYGTFCSFSDSTIIPPLAQPGKSWLEELETNLSINAYLLSLLLVWSTSAWGFCTLFSAMQPTEEALVAPKPFISTTSCCSFPDAGLDLDLEDKLPLFDSSQVSSNYVQVTPCTTLQNYADKEGGVLQISAFRPIISQEILFFLHLNKLFHY
ncbi:hypothetical protein VNO77_14193 [Canavalia gladiata]|uniref:Uncharacterized protein n=1 Tax=Canavalia gladiata TaxID=3824 RepID=A0AAN9LY06_CANGL